MSTDLARTDGAAPSPDLPDGISPRDRERFAFLRERIQEAATRIETDLRAIGAALREIRDGRLYRADYGTFEEFCRVERGWSRQRAYQLIAFDEVVGNLEMSTAVDIRSFTEPQVRPLAQLPAAEQEAALVEAQAEAGDAPVTVALVRRAVERRKPAVEPAPAAPVEPVVETPSAAPADVVPVTQEPRALPAAPECPLTAREWEEFSRCPNTLMEILTMNAERIADADTAARKFDLRRKGAAEERDVYRTAQFEELHQADLKICLALYRLIDKLAIYFDLDMPEVDDGGE